LLYVKWKHVVYDKYHITHIFYKCRIRFCYLLLDFRLQNLWQMYNLNNKIFHSFRLYGSTSLTFRCFDISADSTHTLVAWGALRYGWIGIRFETRFVFDLL
jgi:hypothetical protein